MNISKETDPYVSHFENPFTKNVNKYPQSGGKRLLNHKIENGGELRIKVV